MSKETPKKLSKNSIITALQGLAYWISYKKILYGGHELNEGALVVEFVCLLNAKLDSEFKINCELQYDKSKFGNERMDMEIIRREDESQVAIIEFKRHSAGKELINRDMKRLLRAKDSNTLRFLVVTSEEKLPKGYVNEHGIAVRRNVNKEGGFSAKVIRVLKSTGALKSRNKKGKKPSKADNPQEVKNPPKANYCCLIEILPQR